MMDEFELVNRAKSGERKAFDLLVDRYYRMVYGICLRMVGNAADADELAHDSFVEAYLRFGQIKDPSRLGGWLKTLTLNVCRMWHRRKNRLITVELNENMPEVTDDNDDRYSGMYFGMARLSKAHRLVLVLHYFEGLSYIEIARFLDVPTGTVMSRLSRARNLLREELENMPEESDIQDIPDFRFKEEIQAEVSILLSMKGSNAGVGTRLRGIFEKSPERLVSLIRNADDSMVLSNIAVILPRLGNAALRIILNASVSSASDHLSKNANVVVRDYAGRCEPVTVPGSEINMASIDAYVLIDELDEINTSDRAKAALLFSCADSCRDSASRALFVTALLSYPNEAFDLLTEAFASGENSGNRWVRHALARTGNRFLEKTQGFLIGQTLDEIRLGLLGLETIARCMEYSWIDDSSPERLAHEVRVADKYPPIRKTDLDADLLLNSTASAAGLLSHRNANIRNSALVVLGLLRTTEYLGDIRDALGHEDLSTRVTAVRVLAGMGDVSSSVRLMEMAQNGESEERVAAVEALGQMGVGESISVMQSLITGTDSSLRDAAITALGGIDSPEADTILMEMLKCSETRKSAAKALYGGVKRKKAEPSEVDRRLAEKRRRKSQPVASISLDAAIRYALTGLRSYEERELTESIACVCEDYCATRRYLIDRKLMTRANGVYTFTFLGETVWRVEHYLIEKTQTTKGVS